MLPISETDGRKAAVSRAHFLADRLYEFFRKELEAAASGDLVRLAELNERRAGIDSRLSELEAALSVLGREGNGEGVRNVEFSKLSETREKLTESAREAHRATGKLKETALEGLRVLAVLRRATASYHGKPQRRGTIVDREG